MTRLLQITANTTYYVPHIYPSFCSTYYVPTFLPPSAPHSALPTQTLNSVRAAPSALPKHLEMAPFFNSKKAKETKVLPDVSQPRGFRHIVHEDLTTVRPTAPVCIIVAYMMCCSYSRCTCVVSRTAPTAARCSSANNARSENTSKITKSRRPLPIEFRGLLSAG